MTYVSVDLVIIGSGNGLLPIGHQAITLDQSWLIVNWTRRNKTSVEFESSYKDFQ